MRIIREPRDIDYEATLDFFEDRGRTVDPDAPQTATMYQNGQLARQRDQVERDTVLPLLRLTGFERVLDIGCGSGRWAQVLAPRVAQYLGVDFSIELLRHANATQLQHCTFQKLAAQDISPDALDIAPPFDRFICSGILIYLNDRDVTRLAASIASMATPTARIYLREPMALEERLTLDGHYSTELKREYTAIYRTTDECSDLFGRPLTDTGFRQLLTQPLYPPQLCNRKETMQYISIWERPL